MADTNASQDRLWSRRGFIKASLATAAGAAAGAAGVERLAAQASSAAVPGATRKRPNIIYIVTDDGGKEFSCYGAAYKTPNIDALAAAGVRLENAYVNAACCSPSRGCFYTGRYSHCNGLIGLTNKGWTLPPGTPTIVDSLNTAGYETVLFGKQHEIRHGLKGNPHGYKHVFCARGGRDPDKCQTSIGKIVPAAIKYLSGRAPNSPPFFMYIGTKETHSPHRWLQYKPFVPKAEDVELPRFLPDEMTVKKPFAQFLGAQGYLDDQVGKLMAYLRASGLEESTLVLLTSDHGVSFRRAKGTMYEAGIGAATILRWPGVIKPGTTRDELIGNIDFMPMLLEAAGAEVPSDIHGRSFLPLLTGGKYERRKYIFAEKNFHVGFQPTRAVRDDRYKLIVNFTAQPDRARVSELTDLKDWKDFAFRVPDRELPFEELYDVKNDPHETKNVLADPTHRPALEKLRKALAEWMAETGDFMRGARGKTFWPAEQAERLGH